VGDRVAVLEHAYYSVISPEGCAGILWKSVDFKADAARALRFRAADLKEFGVVDAVIEEPAGGAHRHPRQMAARLKTWLVRSLRGLVDEPTERLVSERYEKFRRMGVFLEVAS
jgi:acetyl-CoA carboxylase carboxyl transferase subunit alpha